MPNLAELSFDRPRQAPPVLPEPLTLALDLPSTVSAAALAIDDLDAVLAALDGGEHDVDVPRSFAKKRRAEFLAGRYAAAAALGALGLPVRVGRDLSGLPLWPSGAVGSIAHGGGVACALCARGSDFHSIGVDVERALLDPEARELSSAIARADELLLLKAALPNARFGQRLSVLFSAKESFFKCLFPLTHEFLEFSDARLVSVGMTSAQRGLLSIRLDRSCGDTLPLGRMLQARFALGARHVESAVLFGPE